VRFALDPAALWGDPVTALRVGTDGRLYQLRSDPATGVSVAGHALAPVTTTPPVTTPGGAVAPSTVAPAPATGLPAPTVTAPAARPAGRSPLPWVMAVAVPALLAAAVGGWRWSRRRRRPRATPPGRPGGDRHRVELPHDRAGGPR
jgi:hypothetical protein